MACRMERRTTELLPGCARAPRRVRAAVSNPARRRCRLRIPSEYVASQSLLLSCDHARNLKGETALRHIQMESEVGNDGVLDLKLPLGRAEAHARILVTIQSSSVPYDTPLGDRLGWAEFIKRTYASCADSGLERARCDVN